MKLASFATGRARVLAFSKAFHGRTSGAVGVTDNPKIRAPFNESGHVGFVSLGDIGAVERELSGGQYAAVIIEGIQGVAGIYEPSEDFLRELRRLCDRHGTLLIADEIQSGYGRSGRFFAHQFSGIRPDIITTAKGMANGFPHRRSADFSGHQAGIRDARYHLRGQPSRLRGGSGGARRDRE